MAKLLQSDEKIVLYPTSDTSISSNPVFVGGRFSICIPDTVLAAVITNNVSGVDLMINNSNPVTGAVPAVGQSGAYSDDNTFAARWVQATSIRSFTGENGGVYLTHDKPVRYISLSASRPAGGAVSLKEVMGGSLSGFVYSDYSASKTH